MSELELFKSQTRCIAHEIRNHLSICELYTQIVKKQLEKDCIENPTLDNALSCIQKSLRIIGNSLLDLKSLNNFSTDRYDLLKLLKNAIELSTVYIQDKNIKINFIEGETAIVKVDENKFLACVVNIIKNGIEAIPVKGEINIKNNIKNGNVHIIISNNGKAISKEKQKQIFNEGFTTKASGSGLGLHICKNNLAAQNAELRLNKSDTKTTEFEIIIPIVN